MFHPGRSREQQNPLWPIPEKCAPARPSGRVGPFHFRFRRISQGSQGRERNASHLDEQLFPMADRGGHICKAVPEIGNADGIHARKSIMKKQKVTLHHQRR
jgi:hypothetical protein